MNPFRIESVPISLIGANTAGQDAPWQPALASAEIAQAGPGALYHRLPGPQSTPAG